MTIYAMLTLDLNRDVSSTQRDAFYQYFLERNWIRLKLTTTFTASYDGASYESALATVKERVLGAAAASGVKSYEVALQLGEVQLAQWKHT